MFAKVDKSAGPLIKNQVPADLCGGWDCGLWCDSLLGPTSDLVPHQGEACSLLSPYKCTCSACEGPQCSSTTENIWRRKRRICSHQPSHFQNNNDAAVSTNGPKRLKDDVLQTFGVFSPNILNENFNESSIQRSVILLGLFYENYTSNES